ncbi:hypothetical protein OS493_000362 [Desmophyllum pertusum]|uniref:Uncharacterized protein n=1 Tax=Desmophyllum pertusum TaxID=174260 RepID=A0A9X0A714_9CNID|nr:hypothetical protein OS493_000362 [Desmophyllum pertusum]
MEDSHAIQPPHVSNRLKELARQAKIYIKPLQKDIPLCQPSTSKLNSTLQGESKVQESIPLIECLICKDSIPMNEMVQHRQLFHPDRFPPAKKQKKVDATMIDLGDDEGSSGNDDDTDEDGQLLGQSSIFPK